MNINVKQLTVRALLQRSFDEYADLPALSVVGEKPFTYMQVRERAVETAMMLLKRGVKKGEKVVILGENSPNWVIAYCAIEYIGAVAVPILTGFPESDVRHIIRHSESVAAFVAEKHMDSVEEIDKSSLHTIYTLEDFTEKELKQNSAKELEKHIQSFLKQKGRKPKEEDLLEHYKPEDRKSVV